MTFTFSKFDAKAPSIFESLEKAGFKLPEKTADYLKEVSQKGLFSLRIRDLEPSFDKVQTVFDESDAEHLSDNASQAGVLVSENIQGSLLSDTITINPRDAWGVHEHVHYWTVVEAHGGNDTIINSHEHRDGALNQMVRVIGGAGVDSFVSLSGGEESQMSILDMEAGETITVAPEFNVVTEGYTDTFHIANAAGEIKIWSANVPEDHTFIQLFDQSGNNVFVCVPEF